MKKFLRKFRSLPLSIQINITIGVIILVTILVLTCFTYLHTLNQTKNNFKQNGLLILQETMDKINSRFRLIENTVEMISTDSRVLDYASNESGKSNELEAYKYLNSCYNFNSFDLHDEGLSYVKNLIDDILLITDKNYLIVRKLHFSSYNILSYRESEWFKHAYENKGKSVWTDHFLNDSSNQYYSKQFKDAFVNNFMLIRYIYDEQRHRDAGWVAISMNLENLSQLIENIQFGKEGRLYITDKNGTIIASKDRTQIMARLNLSKEDFNQLFLSGAANGNFFEGKIDGEPYFIYHTPLAINGWKLVLTLPVEEVESSFYQTVTTLIAIALIAVIIITIISSIVLHSITNPLKKMLYSIQKTRKGDITKKIEVSGCLEVNELCTEFNEMLDTIQDLLKRIMEEQKALRKTELKTLRSQINPHFLYNTLDSIKWLIYSNNGEKASELISALSTFFRIGLSGGRDEIKISDEVEHVRQFLFIQKMRAGDKLNYLIDVDPDVDIDNLLTPKLILQPIVENSILHGINKKDANGIIKLVIKKTEDSILFEITDNGMGMKPSDLEQLKKLISDHSNRLTMKNHGLAVWNVNQRIKLAYGPKYGLNFESKYGVGTKVVISIPILLYNEA
ncbi:MAG: histidine kinase [Clostridiaceae bacterium]|nr:histidine kinase [Clostridiaceae bacterium]